MTKKPVPQPKLKGGHELDQEVALTLNSLESKSHEKFVVTSRSCREKFESLRKLWMKKEAASKRARGVEEEETETDKLTSDLVSASLLAEESNAEKAASEKQAGLDRDSAMQSFSTKKDKDRDSSNKKDKKLGRRPLLKAGWRKAGRAVSCARGRSHWQNVSFTPGKTR